MDENALELLTALKSQQPNDNQILQAVESIRKTEKSKSFDQLFELSFDLMCLMDTNGILRKVSRSFGQVLGYAEEDLLLHSLTEFIPDRGKLLVSESLLSLRKGLSHTQFECSFLARDGNPRWFSWRVVALPDEGLAFVIARDVTSQKESIERLKNFSVQLHDYQQQHNQSLRYARMLQEAIMPDPQSMKQFLPETFVFYQPKDIVSGDFFWYDTTGDKIFIAAADCTGHGVPGALLSILGINILQSALHANSSSTTADLLKHLDVTLDKSLGRKYAAKSMSDGMDISICMIDRAERVLHFSGANNPAFVVRNGELIRLDASRYSLGSNDPDFTPPLHIMPLQENDMIYLSSDGYSDQFGGEQNRRFSRRRLRELFQTLAAQPAADQEAEFIDAFRKWKGREEQTDDVLLIGVRV